MQTLDEAIDEKLICAHCGDPCPDRKLATEGQVFCCLGCKTVYEIIHENGLDAYYRIEQDPGISLKHNKGREYYNFLDKDDVRRRILNFESPELAKVRLFIPVIHCSSCIWLLENLYKLHGGVIRSEVNFPRKEVFIDFNPSKVSLRELVELMASLGYEPDIDIEGEDSEVKRIGNYNRSLLIKIGVAGFCFGNIMLLSFPEYLGLENLVDTDFSRFFSYINILFSLPVLFYSASGYYEAAYKGLKQKVISIDVPIAIGILALSLRSIYEVVTQTGPGYFDSLSGLVFFLLIGKWFQNKTYESLLFDRSYKSYFPVAVTLVGELVQESVLIEDLKIGDTILIRNNELIPADTELLSEEAMIDNSFVTGESTTIRKQKGEYVFAGGRQTGPAIELKVIKEVSQSYLTQLWNNDAFKKNEHSTRRILVDRISKYFTIAILIIAIVASIFWIFYDPSKTINVFTAVLIVACPCALALSTPFAVGTAMRVLSRNGCYLKNGEIIEEMDKVNHVVFDKTGTITNQGKENITFLGELTSQDTERVCAIASNSYHPLSRRIANYLGS
ncbi:MAG: HAD-IC family P-type ATPase, partial [Saprospiraceae bacterium]|nr:HAD-IC family P-type ATPase [Saprospiraceae bacterium]